MTTSKQITRRGFLGRALAAGAAAAVAPHLTAQAASAGAKGWQIAIYTRPWGAFEYRVALDAMVEAGYKHAGLMTTKSKDHLVISANTALEEAVKIGEEIKKRGLQLGSIYGGGIPVAKSLQAGIDGMRKLIDNCAAAGANSLLMGGMGNPKLNETYYKAIAACCDYAAEKGMNVTVKPHGGLNATGPQCRKCVEMVGHKNFGIWYDPGNIYYYSKGQLDPVQDAEAVDGLVFGMSVKDYLPPEPGDKAAGRVDVTPGTGKVNFPALMARLAKGGLTGGPLVVECLAPGDLKALAAEAKKARQFLEKLVGN